MTSAERRCVVGYGRVSTVEQAQSGAGLDAQEAAVRRECERRGWDLIDFIVDAGVSGRTLNRPGITAALDMLSTGEATALVVAKLDRLSRSMLDFASIMATADKEDWAIVALDVAVDTTTPAGEAMAHVMATFAQFERRLIGQRTKEALAVRRAEGVRLGELVELRGERVGALVDCGGAWRPSTIQRVLHRVAAPA